MFVIFFSKKTPPNNRDRKIIGVSSSYSLNWNIFWNPEIILKDIFVRCILQREFNSNFHQATVTFHLLRHHNGRVFFPSSPTLPSLEWIDCVACISNFFKKNDWRKNAQILFKKKVSKRERNIMVGVNWICFGLAFQLIWYSIFIRLFSCFFCLLDKLKF